MKCWGELKMPKSENAPLGVYRNAVEPNDFYLYVPDEKGDDMVVVGWCIGKEEHECFEEMIVNMQDVAIFWRHKQDFESYKKNFMHLEIVEAGGMQ